MTAPPTLPLRTLAVLAALLAALFLSQGCAPTAVKPPATPVRTDFDALWRHRFENLRAAEMADGTIYLLDGDQLVAVDALTGETRWRYRPAAPQALRWANGQELAVGGGHVAVRTIAAGEQSDRGELHVLAAEDGRLLRRIPDVALPAAMWLFDRTLVWAGADAQATVTDLATGAEVSRPATPMSSATVARFGDTLVVKNNGDDLLTALDGATGRTLWRVPETEAYTYAHEAHVTAGRALARVYTQVSAQKAEDRLVAFDPATGAVAWAYPEPVDWFDADAARAYVRTRQGSAFHVLDAATGAVEYSQERVAGTPIVHADGVLYFLGPGERRAVAIETGQQLWRRRTSEIETGALRAGGWQPQFIGADFLYAVFAQRQAGCLAYNCSWSYRFATIARANGDMTRLAAVTEDVAVLGADADLAWLRNGHEIVAFRPN